MNGHREIPTPENLPSGPPPDEEDFAASEAKVLDRKQNLDRKSLTFATEQAARKIIDYGTRTLMIVIFSSVIVSVFIFAWHTLTPACWRWLSEENLLILKSFVFSGAVLGAASNFFKKYA